VQEASEEQEAPAPTHQVTILYRGAYYRATVTDNWLTRRAGGYAGLAKIHENLPGAVVKWLIKNGRTKEISKDLAHRLVLDQSAIRELQREAKIKVKPWPKKLKGFVRLHVWVSRLQRKELRKIASRHTRPSVARLVRQYVADGIARNKEDK